MNTYRDETIYEAIAQQAAEWFVAHRERELTRQEREDYLTWLRASPRHVEAYLNLVGMSAKLPEALAGMDLDLEARVNEATLFKEQARGEALAPRYVEKGTSMARRGTLYAVVAAVPAVLGLWALSVWLLPWPGEKTISVSADQQRVLKLADGSVAHLDSNTRMRIRFSGSQRLIELPEGQALFTVTHDARRPFIVRTGGRDIVAVGTEFDVVRRDQRTEVTVLEGRIEIVVNGEPVQRVSPGAATSTARSRDAGAKAGTARALPSAVTSLQLSAGEQVQIPDEMGSALPVPHTVDRGSATAWTQRVVSFAGTTLQSVADEFNRHTGTRIVIEDAALREFKVSGVFQQYDLDSFVGYLKQLPGVEVVRLEDDEVRVRTAR